MKVNNFTLRFFLTFFYRLSEVLFANFYFSKSRTRYFHENMLYCFYKIQQMMKKNVGSIDRIARIVLALLLAYLYFSGAVSGTIGIILLIIGVVFLGTALIRFCPLYLPFGIQTDKGEKE